MSCVVALRAHDGIWVGSDSAGTALDFSQEIFRTPKVFKLATESGEGPELVIGYTGSYRLGQLIRYHLNPRAPYPDEDTEAYLVRGVLPELQGVMRDAGFVTQTDRGREQGGQFVVVCRGQIFVVQEDFDVLEPARPYVAIGDGAQAALGVLWALEMVDGWSGNQKVRHALKAASEFCATVRGPFTVVKA